MAVLHQHSRDARLNEIARRIRNEFLEMPGLRLTLAQVRRLWHLSQEDGERVLTQLVREQLLAKDHERRFYLQEAGTALGRAPRRRLERSA